MTEGGERRRTPKGIRAKKGRVSKRSKGKVARKAREDALSEEAEPEASHSRRVAARWTPSLVAPGWTVVPDFFLSNYHRLVPPLTNLEALLVIHLIRYKWDDRAPRPAYKTLAKSMGLTDAAVRAHARKLEQKGYLQRRVQVGAPNLFFLEPLFTALETLQKKVEREKDKEAEEKAEKERWDDEK